MVRPTHWACVCCCCITQRRAEALEEGKRIRAENERKASAAQQAAYKEASERKAREEATQGDRAALAALFAELDFSDDVLRTFVQRELWLHRLQELSPAELEALLPKVRAVLRAVGAHTTIRG